MHPGYKHLGDYKEFPEANKVLDKVFFIGAAPHYTEDVFAYIEDVIKISVFITSSRGIYVVFLYTM
jgi:CDP-6-deoxy-D-xylo-4-hexulose-3-dehydrase